MLRGDGVTHPAKRTQGVCRPCDGVPKWHIVGADAVKQAEGNIGVQNSIVPDPAGVREQGMQARRVHQEPGRPCRFRREGRRFGDAAEENSWSLSESIRSGKGSEEAGDGRYLRVKETKPEGRGGRESERLIVPWNQGNRPKGP